MVNGVLTYEGGYGGYSSGELELNKGDKLYINVGGRGEDPLDQEAGSLGGYNGGGKGGSDNNYSSSGQNEPGSGGGGATHVAVNSGILSSFLDDKKSLLIVAGGGGGATYGGVGGNGGGFQGTSGTKTTTTVGTQTAGNAFGVGGAGGAHSSGAGGGGGGFYGGKGGAASSNATGAGGSGYIGNSLLTDKLMYCYNCTTSDEPTTLTYSTTNVSDSPVSNYAKIGNGAVKIKFPVAKFLENGDTYGELPTATKFGYQLVGWNTKSDGSGDMILSSDVINISSDTTLYAIWSKKTITITYNANGGAGTMANTTFEWGSSITLPSNTYTYDGSTFSHWHIYRPSDDKWFGCTDDSVECTSDAGNTTIGYHSLSQIKSYYSPTPGWEWGNGGNDSDLVFYAQWETSLETYHIGLSVPAGVSTGVSGLTKVEGIDMRINTPILRWKDGYKFAGWMDSDGDIYQIGDIYSKDKNDIFTAQWTKNKVIIKYHVNGGTITPSTTSTSGNTYSWTTSSSLIYRNGSLFTQKIEHGESDNLNNYNYDQYINITKTGYTAVDGAEWICASGCTTANKTFDHAVDYTSDEFCDTSKGDCTVTLKVNWRISQVIIKYHVNGGTITSSTTTDAGKTYKWTTSSSLIYRDGTLLTQKINYGGSGNLNNYNNSGYIDINKSGYIGKRGAEWICSSGCTTANKEFDHAVDYTSDKFCDASNGDCTVTVKVNWIASPKYLYNKGTGEGDWDKVQATTNTDYWSTSQIYKESDYLFIHTYASSSTNRWGAFITDSKIDLTGYNTLYFNVKRLELDPVDSDYSNVYLFVSSDNTDQWAEGSNDKVRKFATKTGTISLDVSSLNGKYYIGFRAASKEKKDSFATIEVSQVYLK